VTGLTIVPTDTTATVTWTEFSTTAADFGYSAITGYKFYYHTATGATSGTEIVHTDLNSLQIDLSGLTAATTYYVQILAYNAYGDSDLTTEATFDTTDIPATPAAPTIALNTDNTQIDLTFAAPADNGSPITGYQVLFLNSASSYV
jgi:hypothetical protein